MHEQCMQLNVWLLIEIQIENTLGLMNEKSNILKSHGVGGITFIILSTKHPEIRLRNVLSTKRPTPAGRAQSTDGLGPIVQAW